MTPLGQLVYHKYYADNGKLSKLADQTNAQFDGQDPIQIASHFFALLKMADMMVEEFKAEFPEQAENDVNSKMALRSGFRGYRSESLDYFLEHHDQFPLTMVLFYDSGLLNESAMRNLTAKLLDVFVYKYEKKFQKGNFNVSQSFLNSSGYSVGNPTQFDQVLSLIYEDVSFSQSR